MHYLRICRRYNNVIDQIKDFGMNLGLHFDNHRIFIDTNVLQHWFDFLSYIRDDKRESSEYLKSRNGKIISNNNVIYREILALRLLFINPTVGLYTIFVISDSTVNEVLRKNDPSYNDWLKYFYYFLRNITGFKDEYTISKSIYQKLELAKKDNIINNNFQEKDKPIIIDAIEANCESILTVDKYSNNQKIRDHILYNYDLLILKPSMLLEMYHQYYGAYWLHHRENKNQIG